MKKIYLLLLSYLLLTINTKAQNVILSENFEGTFPPKGWTIKNNGLGNSWSQYTGTTDAYNGNNAMEYQFNTSYPANAWAYTPLVGLNNTPVTITFWVKVQSTNYPESLKFTIGSDTAFASQSTLLDSSNIINTSYRKWTASYTPANAGNYLFAFNCYSSADEYYLFVDSLTITQAQLPCTGTPLGGSVISSSNPVCSNATINLSDTGSSVGISGLTFQWQSSLDNSSWSDIIGATSYNYSFTSLTVPTFFRRSTTCTSSSLTAISSPLQITLNPASLCVCNPANGTILHSSTSIAIDSVYIPGTSLINSTGTTIPNNGYTLNTDTTKMPTLIQSQTYTLITNYSTTSIASVWFDWNQSGTFDSIEWKQLTTTAARATINFTVPANALIGKTLMRIRTRATSNSNGAKDACTTFLSGETEDYLINVVAPIPCSGTPNAGKVITSTNPICSGTAILLSDTGATTNVTGLTYQWQSSPDGNSWTDITGATSISDSVKGLAISTYFRRNTTCTNSNSTGNSSSLLVNINPASLCVCTPANGTTLHSSTSPLIDSVIIVGTVLKNSTGTTAPTNGYSLFNDTSKIPLLLTSSSYTLHTTFNGGTSIASVWFDWNQNGIFETSEWTQLTTSGTAATISFTVPANALLGKTLMRIRSRITGYANAATDACTSFGSGETEDYLITVATPTISIQGNIINPNSIIISNVNVFVSGSKQDTALATGTYSFTENTGGNYGIRITKNNDTKKSNGVNSLDIALIQSHILGKKLWNSPYKIIAADVNGDGKVNSLDIVYIKRLILGLDTTFTNSITKQKRLWVFVDSSYIFPDTSKPFPFKDSINYTGLMVNKINQTFIGCKLGDVNWDWKPALSKPETPFTTKIKGEMKLESEDNIIKE